MRKNQIFWGVVITLIGTALLLNSLGIIHNFGKFVWPLLLIFAGIWILLGPYLWKRFDGETTAIKVERRDALSASVEIHHGAGELSIQPSTDDALILSGECRGGVRETVKYLGSQTQVTLSVPDQFATVVPFMGNQGINWKLYMNTHIPLDLTLKTGADDAKVDLREMQIKRLKLETGASNTIVTLPAAAGETEVQVTGGTAAVKLYIPEGVEARIHTSTGLMGVNINPSRFLKTADGQYESAAYASAANRVDIKVDMGLGSIEII